MPRLIKVGSDDHFVNPDHVVCIQPHRGYDWTGPHMDVQAKSEIILVAGKTILSELSVDELVAKIEANHE